MKKPNLKPVLIAVSSVVNDKTRNVREVTDDAYDIEPLINDIQLRGQQDAATFEKIGDKYYPIKGFRRTSAMFAASERGLVYGEHAPSAGKPMDSILAIVYEDLNERERTELLLDHGQRKGLNRVELQNAMERAISAGYGESEIVTLLYGLLTVLYPPSRKIEEGADGQPLTGKALEKARLDYYKGVLQTAKRIYKAPSVLRDAAYKKLRGEQNWPTNSEIIDLMTIHNKEVESNPLLSRENPGPKFTEKWTVLVKSKTENGGTTRPKSNSMRNRTQVEESMGILECPLSKAFQMIQLGDIPVDRLPVLDRFCNKLWKGELLTDEEHAEVVSWFPKPAEVPPAKTPEAPKA